MRIPDPKANTTTEAYLAYKAGYLEESELKPVLYEPYLHFDGWLAYWAGLVGTYPVKNVGKNLFDKNHAQIINGYFENEGTIIAVENNRNRIIWLPCKENTTYTVKGQILQSIIQRVIDTTEEKPKNGTSVGTAISGVTEDKTFTTPKGASFIVIRFQSALGKDIETLMQDIVDTLQIEEGSTASAYEPYTGEPEMLTDEEALVAYLSGVTNTYPEEIKDPYDVRIVGYLRHLASIRWPEPDYTVNNEEFYLSTMDSTHTSNPVPSSDIELDTAEGKIISVEAYGDTSQQTYSGANLYNYTDLSASIGTGITTDDDGWITCTVDNSAGTSTAFSNYYTKPLALSPSTQYVLVLEVLSVSGTGAIEGGGGSSASQVDYYSKSFANMTSGSKYILPITSKSDITGANGLRTYFRFNAGQSGSITVRFSVLADTSVTPETFVYQPYTGGIPAPNPDYPQEIQTVAGEQTVTISDGVSSQSYEINLVGKNLFDKDNANILVSYFDSSTTTITADSRNRTIFIPCSPNTTYTVSKLASPTPRSIGYTEVIPTDGVQVYGITNITVEGPTGTITTGESAKYLVVRLWSSSQDTSTTLEQMLDSVQIELGSTATTYAPYFEPIELCKIGNYQDYIYKGADGWYVHKACGKVTYNGNSSENWAYDRSYSRVRIDRADNMRAYASNAYCTHLTTGNTATASSDNVFNIGGTSLFMKSTSVATSKDAWTTWLTTHNVSLYYSLATPTDTKITDATLVGQLEALAGANTYNEKTYIKVTATDPNLPALLKVEAYKY